MTYETINEGNVTGVAGIFTYVANVVPIFTPMLLFTIFIVAMLGSYYAQKRMEGKSSFLASFAVASYMTTIIAYFMMLIPGLINVLTLSVVTVITFIATLLVLIFKE